jgi:hypothetical protein
MLVQHKLNRYGEASNLAGELHADVIAKCNF